MNPKLLLLLVGIVALLCSNCTSPGDLPSPQVEEKDLIKKYGETDPERDALILNEGAFGHETGSLVRISPNGKAWESPFVGMNDSLTLGITAQDLYISGDRLYVTCKQGKGENKDSKIAGKLVVMDAKTFKLIAAYDPDVIQPGNIAVADEEHIYLRNGQGIYFYNSVTKSLTEVQKALSSRREQLNNSGRMKIIVYRGQRYLFYLDNGALCYFRVGEENTKYDPSLEFNSGISRIMLPQYINGFDYVGGADGTFYLSAVEKGVIPQTQSAWVIRFSLREDFPSKVDRHKLGVGDNAYPYIQQGSPVVVKGDTIYFASQDAKSIYRHIFSDYVKSGDRSTQKVFELSIPGFMYGSFGVHPISGRLYITSIKGHGMDYLVNSTLIYDPDRQVVEHNISNVSRFPAGVFFYKSFMNLNK